MPISLLCPKCNVRLKAPDAAAGRTLTCPGCRRPLSVPAPPQPAASESPRPANRPAAKPQVEQEQVYDVQEAVEDASEEIASAAADEEGVETLEEVPDAEDLDEVVPACDDFLDDSRLLGLREVHLRARQYGLAEKLTDQDLREYDLCLPDEGRRLGRAREVRDAGTQAARLLGGRLLVSKRLEICEGPDGNLLGTVCRSPILLGLKKTLEIRDGDGQPIGLFEMATLSALAGQAMWIWSPSGTKQILQLRAEPSQARYIFLTPANYLAAELVRAEQGIRIHFMKRGATSYYLRFRRLLDGRPRDKLLCLAVALMLES